MQVQTGRGEEQQQTNDDDDLGARRAKGDKRRLGPGLELSWLPWPEVSSAIEAVTLACYYLPTTPASSFTLSTTTTCAPPPATSTSTPTHSHIRRICSRTRSHVASHSGRIKYQGPTANHGTGTGTFALR